MFADASKSWGVGSFWYSCGVGLLDSCDLGNFLFDDVSKLCGVGLVDIVVELVVVSLVMFT